MKRSSVQIWYQKPIRLSAPRLSEYKNVEDFFSKNFENGYPVLVSSARSAIAVLLELFWDKGTIKVFKYASQCVVNACTISNISPVTSLKSDEDIIYHQWGYPAHRSGNSVFIEDACDSFKPFGSKVLSLESRFEVWSLSKILGLRSGAIIWCRHKEDAHELIKFRNSKRVSYLKMTLNIFKKLAKSIYNQWEYLELSNCSLSKFQIGAIHKEIINWKKIYDDRVLLLKSKIYSARKLGYKGVFEKQEEILQGTLLPSALVGSLGLDNFAWQTLLLNRINVADRPYLVRIIPSSNLKMET